MRRSTRRRRGGAGTSSSPRGRRAASARRSGRAAGTPSGWSCCRCSSASCIAARKVESRGRARFADSHPGADQGRQHPLSRRRRRVLRREVGHRLRPDRPGPGARRSSPRRSAASRRRSATRSRSAPGRATSASTSSSSALIERPTVSDISPGMLEALTGDGGGARARGDDRRHRGRDAAVRRRQLRPRLRPRRPPPHPGPRAGVRRVPPRPAAGRHDRLLRRAVALRRPARGAAEACRGTRRSDLAPGAARRGGERARWLQTGAARHELEPDVDVHAFVPDELEGWIATRRLRVRPRQRRGARRERLRLAAPLARVERRPERRSRGHGATSPSAATSLCSVSTPVCSSPGCRPSSSTTWS